ncbi:hypothetical protein ACFFNX_18315 [Actinoallomurus acaciae]|uniref:Uncharacterized protein n=1 Tax=Actinoallomurus acaciae TaxID=502577 RepID=A0ABV5YGG5_9ACTN
MGGEVVADQAHLQFGLGGLVDRDQELFELGGAVPAAMLEAAGRLVVSCRSWSWVRCSGMPGIARTPGTIRHRNAYDCVEVAARAPRSNSARSAAVTANGAFGRPVLTIGPA